MKYIFKRIKLYYMNGSTYLNAIVLVHVEYMLFACQQISLTEILLQ
jgi:hypothetical protein